jgi:hypothetical protein
MKQHGCFVLMLALLMSRSLAAEGPQVTITNEGGVPQIQIAETGPSCPTHPIDDGLRQRIIDVAAHEWAEFDFPRLSLRPLVGYNVLPPGISPDQRKTRASGGFVARVLPVGAMEDDAAVRMHIGRYWASTPQAERVFRRQNETWSASRGRAGWTEYWSAAFVSYVMCMAGLKNEEFGRSGSHVKPAKCGHSRGRAQSRCLELAPVRVIPRRGLRGAYSGICFKDLKSQRCLIGYHRLSVSMFQCHYWPFRSRSKRQARLSRARWSCRQASTRVWSVPTFRQNRRASGRQAACSCVLPEYCAYAAVSSAPCENVVPPLRAERVAAKAIARCIVMLHGSPPHTPSQN